LIFCFISDKLNFENGTALRAFRARGRARGRVRVIQGQEEVRGGRALSFFLSGQGGPHGRF